MNAQHLNQFIKVLNNFDGIFAKAAGHADQRKFDVNVYMNANVTPDMWPFSKQIQVTYKYAMEAGATLSHKTPITLEEPKTWNDLRENVKKTAEYLKSLQEADYSKIKDVKFAPVWAGGMYLSGDEAFYEFLLPNFYFHATTAYNILRGAGVALGKGDFTGSLNFKKP